MAAIAAELEPTLIARLAQTPGYVVWALRLGSLVQGTDCEELAREHENSGDYTVRYWARRLLEHR